jgi:hypothetical protein
MRFYKYGPLGEREIQLIELSASSKCNCSPGLPIQIRYVSLEASKGSHEALSYSWVSPTGSALIFLRRRQLPTNYPELLLGTEQPSLPNSVASALGRRHLHKSG